MPQATRTNKYFGKNMITTVPCPHCKNGLCIQNLTEVVDLICSGCNARYLASFAVLTGASSQIEQSDSANTKTNRIYDLRVLAQNKTQSIRLVLPSQRAILSLVADDKLLLLYVQNSGTLALVINMTADWKESLISSWENHVSAMVGIAAGIVVGGYLLGANFLQGILPAKVAPFAGITLAAPIAFVTVKKLRRPPFIETDEKAIAQLSREQELLQKMAVLQGKLDQLNKKREKQLTFQRKSDELHSQLLNVPRAENYQAIVSRGKALAQKHEAVLQKLIEGYQQNLNQIQIALNASRLVESLPENALFDDMAELEALDGLERQRLEIEAQLDSLKFIG